jgi:Tol biopolymer transport system component
MNGRWISTAAALVLGVVVFTIDARGASPENSSGQGPGQIIFSSNRAGPWRIWSIRPDGSAMRQLSQAGADEQDVDPVFSPDGKSILFTSTRGGKTGVWRMPADGPAAQRICDGDQAEWSPDGRQIVFRSGGQLFVREMASGHQRAITPQQGWPHCSGPAWSPDGRFVAMACRWDAGNALFLVPAAGGPPIRVYDKKGACEPHWSPDGKRLVYETETHICTIDPDGKKNRIITFFGGVQRYGRFSPDGKSIVFCQGESEHGPWELYIVPSSGGTPQKLTDGGSDMNPDWR